MTAKNAILERYFVCFSEAHAGIAQLVEQLICNQQVRGSNPRAGLSSAQSKVLENTRSTCTLFSRDRTANSFTRALLR